MDILSEGILSQEYGIYCFNKYLIERNVKEQRKASGGFMKRNKLLITALIISFLINIGLVYHSISFRYYLTNSYVQTLFYLNKRQIEYSTIIGQGKAIGSILDKQWRMSEGQHRLCFLIFHELGFALDHTEDHNLKMKIINIYRKYITRKSVFWNIKKAYYNVHYELEKEGLDKFLLPVPYDMHDYYLNMEIMY